MSSSLPIGVFDSGVGGLSILSRIHQLLPAEALIYVADSAHAPYGPKGDEFIVERSRRILDFFLSQKVKAVVVACNTATAAAVKMLRQEYSLPIVGMEPAIKPAVKQTRSGVVGVLATEGTLASDKFVDLKSRFETQVEFITVPCPGLVEEIEKPVMDLSRITAMLDNYVTPLVAKGADTIVLGCTHYSFIADQIRCVAGQDIAIIDTDDAVARRLGSVLAEQDLLRTEHADSAIVFYSSGKPDEQVPLISRCWGTAVNVQSFPG